MDVWNSNKLPERLPFSKKRLPKRVIFSYIFDYVIVIVLIVTLYIIDKIPPFHQPFALENYTLHYPYAEHERIPVFELCLICVAAPAGIIAVYTLILDGLFSHQTAMPSSGRLRKLTGRYRLKDRLWELNCGILGLGVAVGAAFTITGALKNAIGKPRPDLISRCNPRPEEVDAILARKGIDSLAMATIQICNQDNDAKLQDGFKSFPSGHASTAFAGLFYLSLYLAAKMHVLDSKGEVWKTFIVMVPTLGAALVAGSRIMDARHHPFDVISGGMLGILVAWAAYRQYFPPVSETWRKGRAYPIRSWGLPPVVPVSHRNMEEDIQPLRPVSDEEHGEASGFNTRAETGEFGEHNGNVFREQISASQRQRQGTRPFAVQHSDTMQSSLSTKVTRYQNQLPSHNPFANDTVPSRGRDNYDYSSSEEEDSFELQQTHTLPAPRNAPAYNPVAGRFTETGYHPPAGISPNPTPPPALNVAPSPVYHPPPSMGTGDMGDSREATAPAVPPHATTS
ncbi:lipid phosphate phosphatase-like protein 1 [Polyplosphaeria fusca]|uniref:Lipid phosphate phosphatase-like protein 1 n=1 Tax=Polyplosphaeria fusca TaxID=682080 RepID=A0A9P4RDB5_9PLEO|nr:lipid phosphate phosphatase-like protein 1 [Polyplosphaeria fusca]